MQQQKVQLKDRQERADKIDGMGVGLQQVSASSPIKSANFVQFSPKPAQPAPLSPSKHLSSSVARQSESTINTTNNNMINITAIGPSYQSVQPETSAPVPATHLQDNSNKQRILPLIHNSQADSFPPINISNINSNNGGFLTGDNGNNHRRIVLGQPNNHNTVALSPHPSKAQKRAYLLYNLFNGLLPLVSTNSKKGFKANKSSHGIGFRYGVGPGNNDKLIEKMLRVKGMTSESFFSKCNFIWTQASNKRTSVINISNGVEEYDLVDEKVSEKIRMYKIKSESALASQVSALKLFYEDPSLDSQLTLQISKQIKDLKKLCGIKTEQFILMNHIKGLKYISKKHMLYSTMKSYCEAQDIPIGTVVPQTWVLQGDTFDVDLENMLQEKEKTDSWKCPLIIKPGENSNRGQGIVMARNATEARTLSHEILENRKSTSTVVVQTYITNPLLFLKRKFDIRCYALVIRYPSRISYFWYRKGYARTCSFEYSADVGDNLMVHLTNEAVQVKGRQQLTSQTARLSASTSQATRSTTRISMMPSTIQNLSSRRTYASRRISFLNSE